MKKSIVVTALAFAVFFNAQAQTKPETPASKQDLTNQPDNTDVSLIDHSKPVPVKRLGTPAKHAEEDIKALKNGVLLVRLRTSDQNTEQLKKGASANQIKALKDKQDKENKLLVKAFADKYTFSPVYFFYSTDSEKIRTGDFTSSLLNAELKPAKANLSGKPFFVAELTDIEQPESKDAKPGEGNISSLYFRALVMRDKDLNQLAAPFPFYIKKVQNIPPRTRSEEEMVKLLDEKLKVFYKENNGR